MNSIFVVKEGSLLVFSDRSPEYLSSEPISYCDYTIKERIKSVNSFFVLFFINIYISLKIREILFFIINKTLLCFFCLLYREIRSYIWLD